MYQMIAFDMDGTLLQSDHSIAQSTLEAISRANQKGKEIVLSTGRPLSELAAYLPLLTDVRYGVLTSGAFVYDFTAKQILDKKVLKAEVVQEVVNLMARQDMMLVIMLDGQGYLQKDQFERISDYHLEKFKDLYQETALFVDDIASFLLEHQTSFEKINLYHLTQEDRRTSLEMLKPYAVALVETEVTGLEITAQGADKGQGLSHLCDVLGISMSSVIAVGDADNDISMIRMAGLGLAMGNANATIKQLADHVLADNDSGGCAQAIDEYLLT